MYTASLELGAYAPNGGTDPNLGTTESNVTWENRWTTVDPSNMYENNFYTRPVSTQEVDGDEKGEFVTWDLDKLVSSTYVAMSHLKICLATVDEDNERDETTAWHYFASSEFADTYPELEFDDIAPRVWHCRLKSVLSVTTP